VSRARGDIGLDGFLNVCKAAGPTSHDVVAAVRRLLGTRRVGHAGTLDPLAEGVLPLALGRATRLIDRLAEADKEYHAEAVLGLRTSTDDAAGEVLERHPVPPFAPAELDAALAAFEGEIEQLPPRYSALKVAGRRAYDWAREGREVTVAPRRVTIHRIERCGWDRPVLSFRVRCSKGTYVRALVRDLGERVGVGGSLRRLVRLQVGPFHLRDAVGTQEVRAGGRDLLLAPDVVVLEGPALVLGEDELDHLRHGRPWPSPTAGPPLARAYTVDGRLAGLLTSSDGYWRPKLVFLE
jgi:tRNA pseudouridine55 synthase